MKFSQVSQLVEHFRAVHEIKDATKTEEDSVKEEKIKNVQFGHQSKDIADTSNLPVESNEKDVDYQDSFKAEVESEKMVLPLWRPPLMMIEYFPDEGKQEAAEEYAREFSVKQEMEQLSETNFGEINQD